MRYSETTVWITGASSGIGEALALHYAGRGASVVLSSRKREKLAEVAQKCYSVACDGGYQGLMEDKFFVVPIDMADQDSISRAWVQVQKLTQRIDILINNAGVSQRALTRDATLSLDRKVMEINFFGTVMLTKLVLPHMLANGGGHVAAVSSIVGKFGFPLRSAYSASKHAIKGFFESLDAEERKNNIFVTLVYPGFITTNISINALAGDGSNHGQMDNNQAGGMPVDICAKKIARAIEKKKHEVLVGRKELLLVHIRRFLPFLYYRLASKVNPT